jgi:hypothetical protein
MIDETAYGVCPQSQEFTVSLERQFHSLSTGFSVHLSELRKRRPPEEVQNRPIHISLEGPRIGQSHGHTFDFLDPSNFVSGPSEEIWQPQSFMWTVRKDSDGPKEC